VANAHSGAYSMAAIFDLIKQSTARPNPAPPIESQTSVRSFYHPFNKLSWIEITSIPARAIPVTEVYQWQPQPKLP
jgi:hypothetical protein